MKKWEEPRLMNLSVGNTEIHAGQSGNDEFAPHASFQMGSCPNTCNH